MNKSTQALIIVDVQNDFGPGGALPVPSGDEIVPVLNQYIRYAAGRHWLIVASRDWHPEKTHHFREFGGQWPRHCVHDTPGACFHPQLALPAETVIVSKGMNPDLDSCSAFHGMDERRTSLQDILVRAGVKIVYVGGLAAEYCVRATVLDAVERGFAVKLLVDAIRGVNRKPADAEAAQREMLRYGAQATTVTELSASR
ncbi:MAG: isochorismatase family protein [Candidatus Omnitrophica bacterium]|nr:isochorismatase family protein [Candidatus Omnitrophota bacterium]